MIDRPIDKIERETERCKRDLRKDQSVCVREKPVKKEILRFENKDSHEYNSKISL